MQVAEKLAYKTLWTIRRYADDAAFERDDPFAVSEIDGNLLLNEGIGELLDLACGLGTPTNFGNTSAYIGVGDSTTAEAASQTDLQAASNKTYKAMSASYPQRSGQTVTWRAVFGSADANYAWEEFTIANGSSGTAKNLNRKVSSQGTKASGQTWTVDVSITLS
ncbi:MAG: hypothetical protein GC151_13840 [Betaproteobacteria bacterium]|nr:hypothetical protein [Betaproteobacteria bacterium]